MRLRSFLSSRKRKAVAAGGAVVVLAAAVWAAFAHFTGGPTAYLAPDGGDPSAAVIRPAKAWISATPNSLSRR